MSVTVKLSGTMQIQNLTMTFESSAEQSRSKFRDGTIKIGQLP